MYLPFNKWDASVIQLSKVVPTYKKETRIKIKASKTPPHLCIHLRERRPQLVRLPPEDDGLRAGVQRGHLHRNPRGLQDLVQGVALRTYDVLVLRLLHLHGDGGGLPLLQGRTGGEED